MSSIFNPNYVQTTYKENKTDYPKKLVNYIIKKYNIKKGNKILDIGCGDGVLTKCFIECGIDAYGIDISDSAKENIPSKKFKSYKKILFHKMGHLALLLNLPESLSLSFDQ